MTPASSPKKLNKSELEALVRSRKIESWTKLGLSLINALKWVGCWYFFYLGTKELAGRTTLADIRLLGQFSISEILGYGGTAVTGVGWYRERKLRRKEIRRLAPQRASQEKELDPGRTSSGLTLEGLTNPEDAEA